MIVCMDSYFASVPAAEEYWNHEIRLIGVIKMVMRQFPMMYLSNIDLHDQGDMIVLLTRLVGRKNTMLGDFVWMDPDRRYFIFTRC